MMDVDSYRREAFTTFSTYNSQAVKKEDFSQGGFIYTNTSDRVKCKYCDLSLEEWDAGDNPLAEHRTRSPLCPFVLALDYRRIAPYGAPEKSAPSNTPRTTEERVRTFKGGWPKQMLPKPEELAQAGFYYTGQSDKVLCADCGLGCNEWEPTDNPWIEHLKYSPNCMFLRTGPSLNHLKNLGVL